MYYKSAFISVDFKFSSSQYNYLFHDTTAPIRTAWESSAAAWSQEQRPNSLFQTQLINLPSSYCIQALGQHIPWGKLNIHWDTSHPEDPLYIIAWSLPFPKQTPHSPPCSFYEVLVVKNNNNNNNNLKENNFDCSRSQSSAYNIQVTKFWKFTV